MNYSLKIILAISLLVKLIIGAWLPLSPDESYYWVWSHHLQWSYYDHPAFVAWLFYAGQIFEGFGQAVRWPAILMGQATLILWIRLLQPHFSTAQLHLWLFAALLTPLLGPGSLIVTPDIPLMFFWSLSLFCLVNLGETKNMKWAAALGLAMGLGWTAKYNIVLLAPLGLIWLLWLRISFRQLIVWGSLAFPCFLITSFPVWYWNFKNEFISFAFQLDHGLGGTSWNPEWTRLYILGQVGLIFPTILWLALKNSKQAPMWMTLTAWGVLGFFLLTSFRGHVEANWPIPAYPAFIALALWSSKKSHFKIIQWTLLLWGSLLAFVLIAAHWAHQIPYLKDTKLKDLHQFDSLIPLAEEYQPLYARSYQMAARLSYESGHMIYKAQGVGRRDFYDSRPEAIPQEEQFFLILERQEAVPEGLHSQYSFELYKTIDEKHQLWKFERR